jgi:hypothetical protein
MKLRALCIAFTLFAVSFVAPQAWACKCAPPSSPGEEFGRVGAVFTGEVTGVGAQRGAFGRILDEILSWVGWRPRPSPGHYRARATLNVMRSWKGVTSGVATVSGYGSDCDFRFVLGKQYLVYASGSEDSLEVTSCSRTTELSLATADMSYLATIPELSAGVLSGRHALALAIAICAVLLLVTFLELRRRRKSLSRPRA